MIKRELTDKLRRLSKKIPVISITGPRQSGKTTLAKLAFDDYEYVTLENPQTREYAKNDPVGFLDHYGRNLIIDEVQYAPELFSYIMINVDQYRKNGMYVITGSQNLQISARISQSLAGRVLIFKLFPLSIYELQNAGKLKKDVLNTILTGFYPRIYKEKLNPGIYYQSYINTYLERDVRQIINLHDLSDFQRALKLLAGRAGQILNLSAVSGEIGISYKTLSSWVSALEQSYIIYLVPPYYKNFKKRIMKTSKLYFYDTGLLCWLLEITNKKDLDLSPFKGSIYETFVMSELMKVNHNSLSNKALYFWRDSNGNEVDCLMESAGYYTAIEIKSTKTFREDLLKGLNYWKKLNPKSSKYNFLVYSGNESYSFMGNNVINWLDLRKVFEKK